MFLKMKVATDGTGGNYLKQSFNRWFALMKVKRGK